MAAKIASLVLAAALLSAFPAHALLFRAYLASDGSDANPCTLQLPCRLLPAALAAVESGGEIWMLDSANYNASTVTIGKSVSIQAVPGVMGSLVSTGGGAALVVSGAGLQIALRNLSIGPLAGFAAGTYGLHLTGPSTVLLDRCVIANLFEEGIRVAGEGNLRVVDSVIRNSGGWGLNVHWGGRAVVSRSQFIDNAENIFAYGTSMGTTSVIDVSDSVITGGNYGVRAYTTVAATARINVTRTRIHGSNTGVISHTSGAGIAEVSISGSMVTGAGYAFWQSGLGSFIYSTGDNHSFGNVNPDNGSLTTLTPK